MEHIINNSKINESSTLYYKANVNNSEIGENCIVGDFSRIYNSFLKKKNRIDRNSLIYHSIISNYSYVGRNSTIMHSEIGKFCSISWGVTIGPANHDYTFLTTHDFLYNDFYGLKPKDEIAYDRFEKKTTIGNDVWIGANAIILNGIKIGDGAVIGAGSIVTKNIPPYSIVVGSPAKIVKKRFSDDIIKRLLEIQWWDFNEQTIKDNWNDINNKNISDFINKF